MVIRIFFVYCPNSIYFMLLFLYICDNILALSLSNIISIPIPQLNVLNISSSLSEPKCLILS